MAEKGGPHHPHHPLILVRHAAASLLRAFRSVEDFVLRRVMYNGQISAVIHAVDIRSGTTVALKLYKRSKLTDVERRQVGTHMGDGVGPLD